MKKSETPINFSLQIDSAAVKQLAKEGRLSEFVDAFPHLVAGHLKDELVSQLVGGRGVKLKMAFLPDEEFGTVPPRPIPLNDAMTSRAWAMRRLVK